MSFASMSTAAVQELPLVELHHGFRLIEGGKNRSGDSRGCAQSRASQYGLFVLTVVMLLVLGAVWHHVDLLTEARREACLSQAKTAQVVVMPGDTLWSIAEEHPVQGCTTSQVVHHIVDSNGLSSSALDVGMLLEVPEG